MNKDILLPYSILGGSKGITQSAIVAVKNDYSEYGMRVFLGCSSAMSERDTYEDVADWGDEISFKFIELLYKTMLRNKEEKEKSNE